MNRFTLFFICFVVAYAQIRWSLDGVRISESDDNQRNAVCVSDMNGGAIVVWEDNRYNWNYSDIWAQRVDSSGNRLWQVGGVPVCTAAYQQEFLAICSDGAGGAIVAWQDYRNPTGPDIYAQRIDGNGNCLWQADGVPVCTAARGQQQIEIVSDGASGAIIIWQDSRNGVSLPLYAQRIDAGGNAKWQSNGVAICTTAANCWYPSAVTDGVNGAYLVWHSGLYWSQYHQDIFFQHIDSSGNYLLPWTGRMIVGDTAMQQFPKIVRSIEKTFIVVWVDGRNASTTKSDIYALRIDTLGNPLWDSTGLPVCTADSTQDCSFSNLVPDGLGGAMICWWDQRNGNPDVYAQRIDMNGNRLWGLNGVPVCSLPGTQWEGPGISDDSMGVIFKWPDDRNDLYEEYLQRIGPDGIERWTPQGVRACTVSVGPRAGGMALCTDGRGGAITAWTDPRYDTFDLDIWGQRVNDGHSPAIKEAMVIDDIEDLVLEVYPNPFRNHCVIKYALSTMDYATENRVPSAYSILPTIRIYDATGRLVRDLSRLMVNGKCSTVSWSGDDDSGKQLPAGVYFCRLEVKERALTKKIILLKEAR
ncbi:MAG: T9SS type A sorting domain-containing protein [candidate division WOR-3 bacterium]